MTTTPDPYFSRGIGGSLVAACVAGPLSGWHALHQPATRAMDIGTAIHAAILEPHRFPDLTWVKSDNPGFRKKDGTLADSPWLTTEGKAIIEANKGRIALSEWQHDLAIRYRSEVASYLLTITDPAHHLLVTPDRWVCERPIMRGHHRCKPDILIDLGADGLLNIDIKTARNVSLPYIRSVCVSTADTGGYDVAALHYEATITAVTGRPCSTLWLFCHSDRHELRAVWLTAEHREHAAPIYARAIATAEQVHAAWQTPGSTPPAEWRHHPATGLAVPRWASSSIATEEA
jgi:hypothetical protein